MSLSRSRFAEAYDAQQAAQELSARSARSERGFLPRRFKRFEHLEFCDMLLGRFVIPVSTLNISKDGIAVRVPNTRMPEVSGLVGIRLCDGLHLCGSPVWYRGDQLGIKFSFTLENVEDIIHLENRDASIYRGWRRGR